MMTFWKTTLAAMLATACVACGGEATREYPFQGQILSVAADGLQANIKHEEIPGFMAAMTMSYKVRDQRELAGLKPGDLITATLVVVSNDAYLIDVSRVGEAPLEPGPDTQKGASSGFELLRPGDEIPLAPFVDQDGNRRDFSSFRGSTTVVTFIYTRCPMPTFCPLMDRHFATIQQRTGEDPVLKDLQLVSVSFDPVVDTPPVLKQHAESLGANPERWTFLTGDRDEVDRFAMRFGVSIMRDMDDPTDISHNLRTAIVDADGRLVKAYTGNEWTPEQLLADLRALD